MRATSVLAPTLLAAVAAVTMPAATATAADGTSPCRDAAVVPVRTGAVFNNPAAGDPTAVVRQVCNLVKQAPAGSRIRIAHFVVSGEAGLDFATELVAAHQRGVHVQLVLDGWQVPNPAVEALRAEFGTDRSAPSFLHVCSRLSPEGNTASCLGTKGNHNKFYLFSETGGRSDVVLQSSANFTDLNSRTYWNNAVTFVENRRLYAAYDRYFGELAAEQHADHHDDTVTTGMPGGSVTAYFFPRVEGDPVIDHLAKVGCTTAATIRIGMSEWDTYRLPIAQRLVELAGQGCQVRIVHGLMADEVRTVLSAHPNIALRELDSANVLPGRIHSKYLLVEGNVDGDTDARWVLTGSPNFNQTSLRRNDEAMVRTNIRSVYQQYRNSFEQMYAAAL
ncbi:phospholipase D-like domain-containing protein [Micromonospora inyonensis]|uniref:phospholipase D n=1 Tax=Micromonospora inyonensis TaxID=47866 RepID=A0A1C6RIQ5_9ACTN|nr:phospholipase D-like domain-containing protein [Micromonospora inyonensis]SCL17044.1 Phosphatidylserine/phosphatidylglycerophosphate/cardiolipin synthase [Micromonospora inyonensis]